MPRRAAWGLAFQGAISAGRFALPPAKFPSAILGVKLNFGGPNICKGLVPRRCHLKIQIIPAINR